MRIHCPITALSLTLLAASTQAAPQSSAPSLNEPTHVLTIPRITDGERLTTDLAAAPWNRAACTMGMLVLNTQRLAEQPTRVYACYDATSLWLAYRCEGCDGRTAQALVDTHDGRVWWDDCVELYCQPVASNTHFFQFDVNAAGAIYDADRPHAGWDPKFDTAVAADPRGYTIAMRIPFAVLRASTPEPGSRWRVNFGRHSTTGSSGAWSWTYNGLSDTRSFGELIFGDVQSPVLQLTSVTPWLIGPNEIRTNNWPGTCTLVGRDAGHAAILCRTLQGKSGTFSFHLDDDRVRTIEARFFDAQGQEAARFFSAVATEPLTVRLAEWVRRLNVIERTRGYMNDDVAGKARESFAAAQPLLAEACQLASDKPRYSYRRWLRIATILDGFDKDLANLADYACTLDSFPDARFALGFESPTRKVLIKDHRFEGWFADHASVSLAANEHEAVQLVVMPYLKKLDNVRVQVSPLRPCTSPSLGTQPSALGTEVSLVGHVDVNDDPPYDSTYTGFWPDPLLNFAQSAAAIELDEHVAFWLDVAAAKGTPAGDYTATITVTADGCLPMQIPLNVHVWAFELPDGTHLQNAFTLNEHAIRGFYKDRSNDSLMQRYYDLVLDHRLGIDNLYRHEPPDLSLIEDAVNRGTNVFNIMFSYDNGAKDRLAKVLKDYVPRLTPDLQRKAYVYGFDEVTSDKYEEARDLFGMVKHDYPAIRTMTTAQDLSFGRESGLRDAIDIWVPLTPNYYLDEADQLRREGRQMWWYICLVPTHPFANWFVEYPALESRLLMGAMSYKYRVDGFLYYMLNAWERNHKPIASGPYTQWDPASCENSKHKWANGDGNLFYPGPDGPLSSIRLENIRDGLEDYEYLYLLAERVKEVTALPPTPQRTRFLDQARPLLAVPDALVRSTVEYATEPAILATWRTQMATAIEDSTALMRVQTNP